MQNLTFTVALEEANLITEALGQMPYVRVFQLVGKLQEQAQAQLNGQGAMPSSLPSAPITPSASNPAVPESLPEV